MPTVNAAVDATDPAEGVRQTQAAVRKIHEDVLSIPLWTNVHRADYPGPDRHTLNRMLSNVCSLAQLIALLIPLAFAQASHAETKLSGYIREGISVNLQDPIETSINDRRSVSMARTTLRLDFEADVGPSTFVAKGRADREVRTSYLKRLETLGANAADGGHLVDQSNESEVREAYFDFSIGERTKWRLGKQQVAWGETDFFQAMAPRPRVRWARLSTQ